MPLMDRDVGMSTSYQKLFMVECYAWLMAGCVIEESRGLAWANGFAPTNGMERRSRALETTSSHSIVFRQDGKRSINGSTLSLRFCHGCGRELILESLTCPSCGLFADFSNRSRKSGIR